MSSGRNAWQIVVIARIHPEDSEVVHSENQRAGIRGRIQPFPVAKEGDRVPAGRQREAFSEWNLPAGGDVQILGKRGAVDLQVARVGVGAAQAHLQVVEDFLYEAVFAILGMLP